jgi:hypothetical protein
MLPWIIINLKSTKKYVYQTVFQFRPHVFHLLANGALVAFHRAAGDVHLSIPSVALGGHSVVAGVAHRYSRSFLCGLQEQSIV